jgi:hypothetical protein
VGLLSGQLVKVTLTVMDSGSGGMHRALSISKIFFQFKTFHGQFQRYFARGCGLLTNPEKKILNPLKTEGILKKFQKRDITHPKVEGFKK